MISGLVKAQKQGARNANIEFTNTRAQNSDLDFETLNSSLEIMILKYGCYLMRYTIALFLAVFISPRVIFPGFPVLFDLFMHFPKQFWIPQ